jgi:ABC-type polar amino acid transport system ATPase subunit
MRWDRQANPDINYVVYKCLGSVCMRKAVPTLTIDPRSILREISGVFQSFNLFDHADALVRRVVQS